MPIEPRLLDRIIKQLGIDAYGIHGAEHWIRVYENGYRLAKTTGANLNVLMWFAVLHDSQRFSNGPDHGHGRRAAAFARQNRTKIGLNDQEFDLLVEALSRHTEGCAPDADITIQTCLDADRLDIGRTGATVDAAWLYTDAAKLETMKSRTPRRSGRF